MNRARRPARYRNEDREWDAYHRELRERIANLPPNPKLMQRMKAASEREAAGKPVPLLLRVQSYVAHRLYWLKLSLFK